MVSGCRQVQSACLTARLAQLAARRSHNPKVVGSIPTLCTGGFLNILDPGGTIGAAGSASVLCTGGPGFDPPIVHVDLVALV